MKVKLAALSVGVLIAAQLERVGRTIPSAPMAAASPCAMEVNYFSAHPAIPPAKSNQ
jgi:hypothetical protein